MWYALHRKAVAAVRNEGKVFTWNDLVSYQCDGEFLKCELPSGRILHYPKPFVEQAESTTNFKRWNLYYQRVLSKTKQWGEVSAWHGLVTENIIMGIEADIMADSLEDLEAAGYNPCIVSHDEAVCHVPDTDEYTCEGVADHMTRARYYTKGLPIEVEGDELYRYQKI
jgi:hypothetical protein